jgi:hypothetical protein
MAPRYLYLRRGSNNKYGCMEKFGVRKKPLDYVEMNNLENCVTLGDYSDQVKENFILDLKRDSMGQVKGCNNPKLYGYSPVSGGGYASVQNNFGSLGCGKGLYIPNYNQDGSPMVTY